MQSESGACGAHAEVTAEREPPRWSGRYLGTCCFIGTTLEDDRHLCAPCMRSQPSMSCAAHRRVTVQLRQLHVQDQLIVCVFQEMRQLEQRLGSGGINVTPSTTLFRLQAVGHSRFCLKLRKAQALEGGSPPGPAASCRLLAEHDATHAHLCVQVAGHILQVLHAVVS